MPSDHDIRIATLLEEALTELRQQGQLDVDVWASQYPHLAAELLPRLRTLLGLEKGLATQTAASEMSDRDSTILPGIAGAEERGFLGPALSSDEIGRFGGCRILREIGRGGMGIVFEAEEVTLARRVALKVMKPQLAASTTARERFVREARATARVIHEHIVAIHHVGEEGGLPFLVMPLLHGDTLDARLAEGPLPLPEALAIGRELAMGLAAAHAAGLVHRDIKPANVFLVRTHQAADANEPTASEASTRVRLLDFGLARGMRGDEPALTESGIVVGTPRYMAPEQARGEAVDHRCDLFSLGCVLYRMTTGEMPFSGRDVMSVLTALVAERPRPPHEVNPAISRRMSRLIMDLLSIDRERRPATARAVAEELRAIEQEKPVSIKPRRWGWIAAALVLVAVGLTTLFAGPAIVRIATNKGELVLESDDDIEVTVLRDGVKVEDKVTSRLYDLRAGEYEIEVSEKPDGLRFYTKKFTLERGGRVRLKVELAKKPDAQARVLSQPDAPAREPADALRREAIPLEELIDAGRGDARKAPAELVAVIGSSRWGTWAPVNAVAYSPDGKLIAAVCGGHTVEGLLKLWDAKTGEVVRSQSVPQNSPGLAFLPDGKSLVLSAGGKVVFTDPWTGETTRSWDVPSGKLAVSADGKRLAVGLQVWDISSGKRLLEAVLKDHSGNVAISPNGNLLAAGNTDGHVHWWEVDTGVKRPSLKANADAKLLPHHMVSCVAFSPDGIRLAAGDLTGTVTTWAAGTGELYKQVRPSDNGVNSLAYNRRDSTILAVGYTGVALIQQPRGQLLRVCEPGHSDVRSLAFSPDGDHFVSGHEGCAVRVWDTATGKPRWPVPHDNSPYVDRPLTFSGDGSLLAFAAINRAEVWDLSHAAPRLRARLEGHTSLITSLVLSPDGKILATLSRDNTLRVWDVAEGRAVRVVPEMPDSDFWHRRLAFTADGKLAVVTDRGIEFREPRSWQEKRLLSVPAPVNSVACSPDGKWVAVGGNGKSFLIELETGKVAHTFTNREWRTVSFSPDSKTLADWSQREATLLMTYDVATGKPLHKGHDLSATSVAWSRDSAALAANLTWWDGVAFRDARGGPEPRRPLSVPAAGIAYSPGGRHLATANLNGTVSIFRVGKAPEPAESAPRRDAEKPFVLTPGEGELRAFRHLGEAVAVLKDGDTIEVHGNGPFVSPLIELNKQRLTLRAAPGYRPRFVLHRAGGEKGWINVEAGQLTLDGCDFVSHGEGMKIVSAVDSRLGATRCRFQSVAAAIEFKRSELTLRDCVLIAGGHCVHAHDTSVFTLENNILTAHIPLKVQGHTERSRYVLRNNTIRSDDTIDPTVLKDGPMFNVSGNLLQTDRSVLAGGRQATWHGRDNLFVQRLFDLAGWNKRWGRDEPGSKTVADLRFAWDWRGLSEAELLAELKRHNHGLKAGPDLSLVGAGEAYLRVLSAQKLVPEAARRPAAPETGPFVLMRDGKVSDAHPTLRAALNDAQTKDVIEIRGDGPFTAGRWKGKGRQLTIRAAPGYRPVLEGGLIDEGNKDVLTLEGLHFRKGAPGNDGGPATDAPDIRPADGPAVRIARLANCSTEGDTLAARFEADSGEAVITSCFLPGRLIVLEHPKGRLLLRDSVLGWCLIDRAKADQGILHVDGCLFHRPGGEAIFYPFSGDKPDAPLSITARRSVFEASGLLKYTDAREVTWTGSGNVYRTMQTSVRGLQGTFKSKEEGSLDVPTILFDASQWKPRNAPDGPARWGFGADVSRVGWTAR